LFLEIKDLLFVGSLKRVLRHRQRYSSEEGPSALVIREKRRFLTKDPTRQNMASSKYFSRGEKEFSCFFCYTEKDKKIKCSLFNVPYVIKKTL
jgi:hypothetical protein